MVLFLSTFRRELFSKKSIFIAIFFIASAYVAGNYSSSISGLIDSRGGSGLIDALFLVYTILGYLFSSALYSGLIAGEVETQTMRFLTPYMSRYKIYLSKYFASTFYFIVLTVLSLIVLFITKKAVAFPIYSLLFIVGFYLYIQALVMLISSLAKSERLSSLLNLMFSILLPIFYTLSLLKNWIVLKAVQWLFPYHYVSKTWEIIFLYLLAAIFVFVGQYIFKRKEI